MRHGDPACVGVVAAGHPETARAGASLLAAGGNAVDAACAAAAAAAVAESPLTGPGAGGFLLARRADGVATVLDFFVAAPGLGPHGRRLTPDMLDSFTVPFGGAEQEFHIGPASVAVPGMAQGLAHAVATLGSASLGEVLAPASALARAGLVVTPEIEYLHEILAAMLCHTPECARIFAPNGRPLRAGDRFAIPELADTYAEVAAGGADTMRADGVLGRAMRDHLDRCGGLLTADDLDTYRVVERDPLHVRRGGDEVLANPPPSAGGVLILAALSAIDPLLVGDEVGFYRSLVDAGIHANAMRDDDFLGGLHAPGFADALLGRPSRKPTGTTNVAVIDAHGNMACLSSSCGSGGGVVVPGTGILLNNMMGEADLNPGGFGHFTPGVRMTSMMAPTIVTRGGHPALALGSAGSNRLRSAILQTLVGVIDRDLDVHSAVDLARVHPEGDGVDVEFGVPDDACGALAAAGYHLRRWQARNLFFGGVSAVTSREGQLDGAGDPRRGGAAAGVTRHGEVVDL